jgi:hypothetical protein
MACLDACAIAPKARRFRRNQSCGQGRTVNGAGRGVPAPWCWDADLTAQTFERMRMSTSWPN